MKRDFMIAMTRALRGPMKPRVLRATELFEIVLKYEPQIKISSFYERTKDLVDIGNIQRIYKGLYINLLATPKVSLSELADTIASGAVVSMHSALSQAGVINNPSRVTTSVLPVKAEFWGKGERSEIKTDIGDFWFYRIPERFVRCEELPQSEIFVQTTHYALATAEKAFADWLYLGASKSTRASFPPLDIELEKMSLHKIRRITKYMGTEAALTEWLQVKKEHDQSENVRMNMSMEMGF